MITLRTLDIIETKDALRSLPEGKLLINTINAHSYNTARKDKLFADALMYGDVLIPDGVSILWGCRWLRAKSRPKERVAGWDLFHFEMEKLKLLSEELRGKSEESRLNASQSSRKPKVMFLGSSEKVLALIRQKAAIDFPDIEVVTYSPPYKPAFTKEEDEAMVKAINDADPDLLWIGMTAPKQEKWAYSHWKELNIHCHCGTVGAVFDFYAGTRQRAPLWVQNAGIEWLYRLILEPNRMWRRYMIGNVLFIWNMMKERWG